MKMQPILILIASIDRQQQLVEALTSMISLSSGLADYYVCGHRCGGVIRAYNAVPMEFIAQYEVVGFLCDDIRVRTQHWDKLVYEHMHGKNMLLYGRDGIQDERLATHPFISVETVLRVGKLAPWVMDHLFLDNYWMEIFRGLGAVRYEPALFTEHLHHSTGKSEMDNTYKAELEFERSDYAKWPAFLRDEIPKLIAKAKNP